MATPSAPSSRMPPALVALNAAAALGFISYGAARHLPIGVFPAFARPTLLRWRRARTFRDRGGGGGGGGGSSKKKKANSDSRDNNSNSSDSSDGSAGSNNRPNPFSAALPNADAKFKAYVALNDTQLAAAAGVTRRQRLQLGRDASVDRLFAGETLKARLSHALASARCVDRKEFFETWEFFARTRDGLKCVEQRTRIRGGAKGGAKGGAGGVAGSAAGTAGGGASTPGAAATTTMLATGRSTTPPGGTLVEVAGGHGLLSIFCAVFHSKRFSRIIIADFKRPASFDTILDAASKVAPWIRGIVEYREADFTTSPGLLPEGCAVCCVHGCNSLTDKVVKAVIESKAHSFACMPCCYAHAEAAEAAPKAVRSSLGVAVAADVMRTLRLEEAGYAVTWRHIPRAITPMNRVLLARRPVEAGAQ